MMLPQDISMNGEILSNSPDETIAVGKQLAETFGPGRVYVLYSDLGGGKTVISKGISVGLGVSDPDLVISPTFTLINCYETAQGDLVYHADLYRLHSAAEAADIGMEEIMENGSTLLLEWPERMQELLDGTEIRIDIERGETQTQRIIHYHDLRAD